MLTIILFFASLTNVCIHPGQSKTFENVKVAIGAGSSHELANYLNNSVEVNIDGESINCDKFKAEQLLKSFFSKFQAKSFSYLHEGSSKEGLKYAIGEYVHHKGTHRAYILFKKVGGEYKIDTIKLSLE